MKKLILLLALFCTTAFSADHTFGWKSNPHHKRGLKQFVHAPGYKVSKLPPLVDLSGQLPDIYNQGDRGECTANAGVAAFESQWKKQHACLNEFCKSINCGEFMNGSRLGLYTDSLKHDGTFPEDAGSYTSTVVWVLKNLGLGQEKYFPHDLPLGTEEPENYILDRAVHLMVEGYDVDNTDGVSVRVAVSKGYPVMFGGIVFNDIQLVTKEHPILPSPKGRPIGGHEMLVVGYDDAKQLYKVRNSWGKDYGDNGHLYIKYKDLHNKRIYEDFAVVKLTN